MGTIWLTPSNGCWMDVWDQPQFAGNHQRVHGPIDLVLLRLCEADWSPKIMSLRVGPAAYCECFEDLNVPASIYWLLPGQEVANVTALPCNDEIDSIRIFDRPPFSQERGYAAYTAQIGHTNREPAPLRLMC